MLPDVVLPHTLRRHKQLEMVLYVPILVTYKKLGRIGGSVQPRMVVVVGSIDEPFSNFVTCFFRGVNLIMSFFLSLLS